MSENVEKTQVKQCVAEFERSRTFLFFIQGVGGMGGGGVLVVPKRSVSVRSSS